MKSSKILTWNSNNTISIEQNLPPKKITGTKLGAILGLNPYSTPFQTWCDITHVYTKPVDDNMFTLAGRTIEPKQAQYMKQFFPNLKTPTEMFGENYFDVTHGNFFTDEHFGGMWDYIDVDSTGKIITVFEMKTASLKKQISWQDNSIPEHYALQAALYAYLLKVDQVYMVASFLEGKNYFSPNKFEPNEINTIQVPFKLSEKYPYFESEFIKPALAWWDNYVITGISPEYDLEKDKEVLDVIKSKETV